MKPMKNGWNMPEKHNVYIGLGSNVGDRLAALASAMHALGRETEILRHSLIYESEPVGVARQPRFLNQVIQIATSLSPLALLQYLKQIEASMGRVPTVRFGPRLIDLDILFYDELVYVSEELVIPHPRCHTRDFVLWPMTELASGFIHPLLKRSMQELKDACARHTIMLYVSSTR